MPVLVLDQPTLPRTNIAPEHMVFQKETIVFQPSIFRCYVSFREGNIFKQIYLLTLTSKTKSKLENEPEDAVALERILPRKSEIMDQDAILAIFP